MRKYENISPYMRRPLVMYDFATAPLWISLYMRKILFSFLSVHRSAGPLVSPWHLFPNVITKNWEWYISFGYQLLHKVKGTWWIVKHTVQFCKHDDKMVPLQLLRIFISCQQEKRQQIKLLPWTLFSHSLGLIFFVMNCLWLHKTLHDRFCMIHAHAHTVSAHLRMFFFTQPHIILTIKPRK